MMLNLSTVLRKNSIYLFIIIGCALFFIEYINTTDTNTILVSKETHQIIRTQLEKKLRHSPSDTQINQSIQRYIDEEVLYQEALAIGLDQNDPMIRQRLIQKMLFYLNDDFEQEPSTEQLHSFFKEQNYELSNFYAFQHIFFDRANLVSKDIVLDQIAEGKDWQTLGDTSPLPQHHTPVPINTIAKRFGPNFKIKLPLLSLETWEGPIESFYGYHFVYITHITEGKKVSFETIKDTIKKDYLKQKKSQQTRQAIDDLRDRYTIDIAVVSND